MTAATNTTTSAKQIATSIAALPPLPATAQEILTCFGDEFIDADKVTAVVEGDAGICAKLLGLANSAYFGLPEPVTAMSEVISRVLGVDTVRSLVLAMAIQQSFNSRRCPAFDAQSFWIRSLTTAECCKRLALADPRATDEVRDLAYSAGLCHNLGLMALAHMQPEETNAALAIHAAEPGSELAALLVRECGTDHRAMTAELSRFWSLPEPMIAAYAHRAAPSGEAAGLTAVLSAGVQAVDKVDLEVEHTADFESLAAGLGMSAEDLMDMAKFGERQQDRLRSLASNMTG